MLNKLYLLLFCFCSGSTDEGNRGALEGEGDEREAGDFVGDGREDEVVLALIEQREVAHGRQQRAIGLEGVRKLIGVADGVAVGLYCHKIGPGNGPDGLHLGTVGRSERHRLCAVEQRALAITLTD